MTYPTSSNLYSQGGGTKPESVEVPFVTNRSPFASDNLYPLGKKWVNHLENQTYTLTSFTNLQGNLLANWTIEGGGGSSSTVNSLLAADGHVVLPDGGDEITFPDGNGITTVGATPHNMQVNMSSPFSGPFAFTDNAGAQGWGFSNTTGNVDVSLTCDTGSPALHFNRTGGAGWTVSQNTSNDLGVYSNSSSVLSMSDTNPPVSSFSGSANVQNTFFVGSGLGTNDTVTLGANKPGAPPTYVQVQVGNAAADGNALMYTAGGSAAGSTAVFGTSVNGAIVWLWGTTHPDHNFILSTGSNLDAPKFQVSPTGAVTFNNTYTFPTTDGTAGQVLTANGSGSVSWATNASSGPKAFGCFTIPGSTGPGTIGNGFNIASVSVNTGVSPGIVTVTLSPGTISAGSDTSNTTVLAAIVGGTATTNVNTISGQVITLKGPALPAGIYSIVVYQN